MPGRVTTDLSGEIRLGNVVLGNLVRVFSVA
jgi:hypothetical protein